MPDLRKLAPYIADHALRGIRHPEAIRAAHEAAAEAAAAGRPPRKVFSAANQAARWKIRELLAESEREAYF